MYPNSQTARLPAQTLALGGQYIPPPYDFGGYQVPGVADASATSWNSVYAPREEYPYYSFPGSSPGAGQVNYTSAEFGGTPTATGPAAFPAYNFFGSQEPYCPRRRAQEPPRPAASAGKTRTKDKYRVVYTDHQRLELEREFQLNRYITMRRKSELSMALSLSERQVKIWFQNRRAKERKINRKKLQHSQQASTTTPTPPVLGGSVDNLSAASPTSNILSGALSDDY